MASSFAPSTSKPGIPCAQRDGGVDTLRCVCIALMVLFHLAAFGDAYPALKGAVYLFHMPVFLLLSGWYMRADKPWRGFAGSWLRLLVPYVVVELLYAAASTVLPVRDGLPQLTVAALVRAVTLAPVGPYWFLHTLLVLWLLRRISALAPGAIGRIVGLAVLCAVVSSRALPLVTEAHAAWFVLGAALREGCVRPERFFRPSLWAGVALLPLFAASWWWGAPAFLSVPFVWCVASFVLSLEGRGGERLRVAAHTVGRNTLPVLLFSPAFTMAAKFALPLFAFDATHVLWALCFTAVALIGSLAAGYAVQRVVPASRMYQ